MRKWQKIQKIWFDILNVQNLLFPIVSSAFPYFQFFTSKNCLKVKPLLQNVNFAKVVNFEPNLDHFKKIDVWYLETSFGKSNYIFRKKKEFCGSDIANFEFFMKIKVKFQKISKLVILEQHFRLENLKMAWNQCYIAKTELFLLSKM